MNTFIDFFGNIPKIELKKIIFMKVYRYPNVPDIYMEGIRLVNSESARPRVGSRIQ